MLQVKYSPEPPPVAEKLAANKLPPPAPKPDPEYCYVGDWKGARSCVAVDKSQCASQSYSTESQCVTPTLR